MTASPNDAWPALHGFDRKKVFAQKHTAIDQLEALLPVRLFGLTAACALDESALGCIGRRMPRMQVYLPDELYASVKKHRLPASELLQRAVRAELRRRDLLAESDRYLSDLVSQVGPPSARERHRARAIAGRIAKRVARKAG